MAICEKCGIEVPSNEVYKVKEKLFVNLAR